MNAQLPMLIYYVRVRVMSRIVWCCRLFRTTVSCWFWGVARSAGVLFAGPVFIRTYKRGTIILGRGVRFNSTDKENPLCRGPMVLDTRLGGVIRIGSGTGLSSAVLSSKTSIEIGSNVFVGANTQIYDHNFHALKPEDRRDPIRRDVIKTASVVIEDDCFVGANCLIMKGTRIGRGSLVSAGSVIFGLKIPPYSIVRGNPAVIMVRSNGK